jgi:hypothetical protein
VGEGSDALVERLRASAHAQAHDDGYPLEQHAAWEAADTIVELEARAERAEAERDELKAKEASAWNEYLAERSARMAANNRELAAQSVRERAEASLRVAVARAFHDGWTDAIKRQPWEDMWDWLALTEDEYAASVLARLEEHGSSVASRGGTAQGPKSDNDGGH